MKPFINIMAGLLLFISPAYSQSRLEADVSIGLFEALSVKAKYGDAIQVGVCQGFFDNSLWMTGIEVYRHFPGKQKDPGLYAYYIMGGFASTIVAKGYEPFEKMAFYPRIGKSFYFSEHLGANLDIGLALVLTDDGLGRYVGIPFPTGGIHLFLRI